MKTHQVEICTSDCVGCGACQRDCLTDNIAVVEGKAVLRGVRCIACGHCVAVCPTGAVTMTGFDQPPIALVEVPRVNPQELLAALQARRSIRQFQDKPVPTALLENILEAGRWTPTAKNAPSVSYLVLQAQRGQAEALAIQCFKEKMPTMELGNQFFFKGAPAVIAVLSKDSVSGALAASNMALMAESQGLGVLYSGYFAAALNMAPALREALGMAHEEKAVAVLVLGYSAVTYCRTSQKDAAVVRWL